MEREIVMLSGGDYTDYSIFGILKAPVGFDFKQALVDWISAKLAGNDLEIWERDYLEQHLQEPGLGYMDLDHSHAFVEHLVLNCGVDRVPCKEVWL